MTHLIFAKMEELADRGEIDDDLARTLRNNIRPILQESASADPDYLAGELIRFIPQLRTSQTARVKALYGQDLRGGWRAIKGVTSIVDHLLKPSKQSLRITHTILRLDRNPNSSVTRRKWSSIPDEDHDQNEDDQDDHRPDQPPAAVRSSEPPSPPLLIAVREPSPPAEPDQPASGTPRWPIDLPSMGSQEWKKATEVSQQRWRELQLCMIQIQKSRIQI